MGDEIYLDLLTGAEISRSQCKCFYSHVIYRYRGTNVAASQIMRDGTEVLVHQHPQFNLEHLCWTVRCPSMTFHLNSHIRTISEPPADRDYLSKYLRCPKCDKLLMYHTDSPAELEGTISHVESCAWEASEVHRVTGEVLLELRRRHGKTTNS